VINQFLIRRPKDDAAGVIPKRIRMQDIELLTIKEVAALLKVSPTSVRRLQQGRHLPFIKVGGSVRFTKNDIVEFLKKERVEAIARRF